tara:strand:- start:482 stop:925 length:444 start_codon:yes stop_codon:yes gene_type:complete
MAKLTINEAAAGFTHKFAFDYVDLQTTGFLSASSTKAVGTFAPGDIIDVANLYVVTAAVGQTANTLGFGVSTSTPIELLTSTSAIGNSAAGTSIYNNGSEFVATAKMSVVNATTATKTLHIQVFQSPTSLTAGSWILAWRQLVVPKL